MWIAAALVAVAVSAWLLTRQDAAPSGQLIVLVTPDTLRRDHVGVFGGGSRTPTIDQWAAGGATFQEARSPIPLTLPAHVTMLAGLPPAATGVRTNAERLPAPNDRSYPLLPERLRGHGWHCAAFVSASVLNTQTGLAAAFDHYDDGDLRERGGTLHVPERAGAQTVRAALSYLRSRASTENLFLWVHLFDPHAPYSETGRYEDGVRAVDAALRPLLASLTRPRQCVVFVSDHGEALGDLGEATHAVLLGDAVLRVPLVIRATGMPAGTRADPAELADIAPTIAAWAGISWSDASVPGAGRSLLTAGAGRASVAESLEGYARYRWAQLFAASNESGTLVDVGEGRFHWLPRAAPGQDQSGPHPASATASPLADVIAQYKQIDSPAPTAGVARPGYATFPGVRRVEDPAVTARRPDPYAVIGRTRVLAQVSQVIQSQIGGYGPIRGAIAQLKKMQRVDPENPALAFWLGRAHEALFTLAQRDRDEPGATASRTGGRSRLPDGVRTGTNRSGHDRARRGCQCRGGPARRTRTAAPPRGVATAQLPGASLGGQAASGTGPNHRSRNGVRTGARAVRASGPRRRVGPHLRASVTAGNPRPETGYDTSMTAPRCPVGLGGAAVLGAGGSPVESGCAETQPGLAGVGGTRFTGSGFGTETAYRSGGFHEAHDHSRVPCGVDPVLTERVSRHAPARGRRPHGKQER